MAPVAPFLADTGHPFKQVLAAEQTSQSIQAWIHEKRDGIQAIKKQTIYHGIPYDFFLLDIKKMEKEISKYKRWLKFNENDRQLWRAFHLAAWRATVRPLKVVDLPHEILTMIFAHFEDVPTPSIQVESSSSDGSLPEPDTTSIKNIRLTCRSFCEAGSSFLLPVVEISLTRSSVRRLEQISNHPTISKGVRVVRIDTDAYSTLLANERHQFGFAIYTRLRSLSDRLKVEAEKARRQVADDCRLVGLIPGPKSLEIREHDMLLRDAQYLLATMEKCKPWDFSFDLPLNHSETKISKALAQAHEEYKQRYWEQERLAEDARICAKISAAIDLMPSVQRLSITRARGPWIEIERDSYGEPLDTQKWRSAFRSSNPFQSMMVHSSTGFRPVAGTDQERTQQFSLLLKLPLVLQAGSRNLTYLDIDLPPVNHGLQDIAADHLQSLRHACQQLRSVRIRVIWSNIDKWNPALGLAATHTLLEAMLASPGLEIIKLDLKAEYQGNGLVESDESVAPLLAGISWGKLQALHLAHVSIEAGKLRELLGKAPGTIHLDLNGIFLLEGTWAEALEILRGRADSSSRVVDPQGVEIGALSEDEADYLWYEFESEHRDGWYSAQRCPGPASFYIRGGNIPNPLIRVNE